MKIYTKQGDAGQTGLPGGRRALKSEPIFDAVGTLDELNAALGFIIVAPCVASQSDRLHRVQCLLFDIGAEIAALPGERHVSLATATNDLELAIDAMEVELAPLTNFILPGGCESAARVHLARAITRRLERILVPLPARDEIAAFVNRLSDYLFVLARYECLSHKVGDVLWIRTS